MNKIWFIELFYHQQYCNNCIVCSSLQANRVRMIILEEEGKKTGFFCNSDIIVAKIWYFSKSGNFLSLKFVWKLNWQIDLKLKVQLKDNCCLCCECSWNTYVHQLVLNELQLIVLFRKSEASNYGSHEPTSHTWLFFSAVIKALKLIFFNPTVDYFQSFQVYYQYQVF